GMVNCRKKLVNLVAGARTGREMLLQLSGDAFPRLGIGRSRLFGRDIGPDFREVRVEGKKFLEAWLGVGLDGLHRTFRLANPAIDALVRMNDEHVLAFIEAVDRANLDAVHVFAFYALFDDDVGHRQLRIGAADYRTGIDPA